MSANLPPDDEIRDAVLNRLSTFARKVEWIGEGADRAYADSIIGNMRWYAVLWLRQVATDIQADVPHYTATALRDQAGRLESAS